MTTPTKASEDMDQKELLLMQNSTVTLEDSLPVSNKIKYTLNIWSSYHVPWYLLKEVKNLCPYKDLYAEVTAVLCKTAKTWKQLRSSLEGECISKMWYIRQYNITWKEMCYQAQVPSTFRNVLKDMEEPSMNKWKKPILKCNIL